MPGSTWMRFRPTVCDARPVRLDHVPAMWPRSPRQVRTSSQCEITSRSCHAPAPRAGHSTARAPASPPSGSRPRLGLLEQRPQLVDELRRAAHLAVEQLDALEAFEDRLRLVHVSTVALPRSHVGNGFAPKRRIRSRRPRRAVPGSDRGRAARDRGRARDDRGRVSAAPRRWRVAQRPRPPSLRAARRRADVSSPYSSSRARGSSPRRTQPRIAHVSPRSDASAARSCSPRNGSFWKSDSSQRSRASESSGSPSASPSAVEDVDRDRRPERVEARRLTGWLGRGDRKHGLDAERPPVERLEEHRARGHGCSGRQTKRADGIRDLRGRVRRRARRPRAHAGARRASCDRARVRSHGEGARATPASASPAHRRRTDERRDLGASSTGLASEIP